ncbi:zinc-dependent metalloprotease [Propionicicella superfundia]|uniref:zinc-dependent metalloprotease n=1 Tax=Propionicicella superfundia TaxID=348582 RepID=UPI00042670E3|nr:zinc-dependent metalloprotease [Propionicicella superfundia]
MADDPTPPTDDSDDDRQPGVPGPEDALAKLLASLGIGTGGDLASLGSGSGSSEDLASLLEELQKTLQQFTSQMAGFAAAGGEADGANWGFAKDIARKTVAQDGPDPTPSDAERREVREAVALANLWLDQVIAFPQLTGDGVAWSRAEWVEHTFPVWQHLVGPIVASISRALVEVARQDPDQPEQIRAMLQPMMRTAAAGMFGGQVGQSIGKLAADVLGGTDVGLPVTPTPSVALLPANLAAFSAGLEQPASDVRLYLALRETARQRLFGAVGWLAPQMLALVEHYAREIRIDPDGLERAIEEQMSGSGQPDLAKLEELGRDFAMRLFRPERTAEQVEILSRLETLLALVEGWVDDVVSEAVASLMPNAVPLSEVLRRRRASGGPAEQALRTLVGLELRPRRVRDAVNLWAALRSARGSQERDAAWAHPDLVPTSADLDDPLGYAEHGHHGEPDSLDAELAELLGEDTTEDDPPQE